MEERGKNTEVQRPTVCTILVEQAVITLLCPKGKAEAKRDKARGFKESKGVEAEAKFTQPRQRALSPPSCLSFAEKPGLDRTWMVPC